MDIEEAKSSSGSAEVSAGHDTGGEQRLDTGRLRASMAEAADARGKVAVLSSGRPQAAQ